MENNRRFQDLYTETVSETECLVGNDNKCVYSFVKHFLGCKIEIRSDEMENIIRTVSLLFGSNTMEDDKKFKEKHETFDENIELLARYLPSKNDRLMYLRNKVHNCFRTIETELDLLENEVLQENCMMVEWEACEKAKDYYLEFQHFRGFLREIFGVGTYNKMISDFKKYKLKKEEEKIDG